MTFNDFLASGDGRLNCSQADLLIADLAQYGVTITTSHDLYDFWNAHRELFCPMTEEDKRDGLQNLRTWWHRYK